MSGLYSFILRAKIVGVVGLEEGATLSLKPNVISRLFILHKGEDMVAHNEIDFYPPQALQLHVYMHIDL